MIGKTIRQLFKVINEMNNLGEVISSEYKNEKLRISVNGQVIYEGDSYVDFYRVAKKELPEDLVNEIVNTFWCGSSNQTFFHLYDVKIEVYF